MMNAQALGRAVAGMTTVICFVAYDAAAQKRQSDATGTVQLVDDFSIVSPNWLTGKSASGETWIEGGAMHVRSITGEDNGSTVVEYDAVFGDHMIEVETTLVDGTDDNWQTVTCRKVSNDSYYDLGISADGYYLVDIWVDGSKLNKSLGPSRSRHILTGRNAVNALRVECVGTSLRLFVNGNIVAEITDSNISRGQVGLSVDSLDGKFSEVAFDNIRITVP